MLLRERSHQTEIFDDESRPGSEIAEDYAQLDRVNRFFRHADPFVHLLSERFPATAPSQLRILEIGAGTGELARELEAWATGRGWDWEVSCLDRSSVAFGLNQAPRRFQGDALDLPFEDQSFDLAIASQMTHHLSNEEVMRHFREAWRVARQGIIISDLHRNPLLFCLFWLSAHWVRLGPRMRADGLLSVRRGFRAGEWQELARRAGLPRPRIQVQFGCRIVLSAFRPAERA